MSERLEVMESDESRDLESKKRTLQIPYSTAAIFLVILTFAVALCAFFAFKYGTCDGNHHVGMAAATGAKDSSVGFPKRIKDVRLPANVRPVSYDIRLLPYIWEGNFTFDGWVKIRINVTSRSDNVTLHAANLNVTEVAVFFGDGVGGEIGVRATTADKSRQFFQIFTESELKRGSYEIRFRYKGVISDQLQGFYRSSYTVGNVTKWLAVTQFQSTDARKAFPCFDEPALKATFRISLGRPRNMSTLSNMPLEETIPIDDELEGYVLDKYRESVPMSTYLVAFAVTDFKALVDEEGKFRVWAREEALEQAKYAVDIGPKILKFYEEYFRVPFPLPKMDMIALPDFAPGAMENWGLITFRELTMLYKEGVSTRYNKRSVASIIAHELAHQWFGNLVTPDWWSDLWLNEGFASYMEYIGTDFVEPNWKILDQFGAEIESSFSLDVLESSHPISVQVSNPEEISEIFDGISYSKGASLIRMMEHFLTTPVFKEGLANYIIKKSYQSANQKDLWDSLTAEGRAADVLDPNVTVGEIMDTWTLQTGFPVVRVERNYENGAILISQSRFLVKSSDENSINGESEVKNVRWWIPLTYTTRGELNFKDTKCKVWFPPQPRIILEENVPAHEWILFNVKQTGYYRVNYDERNWRMLIRTLNDQSAYASIDVTNRAELISDALKLARIGDLNYSLALDATRYLKHETEFVPWMAAFKSFAYIQDMFKKAPEFNKYKAYMLHLSRKLYDSNVGFIDRPDEDQLLVYKRTESVNHACELGYEACVRNAVSQFQEWRLSPQPDKFNGISPNLKMTVYCTAIKIGGQKEWDFLWRRFLVANVGSEKDIILTSLGCSREQWILARYLRWSLNETFGIKKQDTLRVFSAVSGNTLGQPLVWALIRDHWQSITDYLGTSMYSLENFMVVLCKSANTDYELEEIRRFAGKFESKSIRSVSQAIERAASNVGWMKTNYKAIANWLRDTLETLPSTTEDDLLR